MCESDLMSTGVPDLGFDSLSLGLDALRGELNTDGGLRTVSE